MKQNICKAVVYSLLTMTSVNAAAAGLFKPSSAGSNSILQSRQALAGQLNLSANRQRFDLLKGSDGKFTNQMQKFDGYSKGAMGTTGKAADLQNSSAGPNIGGGGYGYYDSSTKHLKTVISILKNSFKFLTEEDFAKINEYFAIRTTELKIKKFIPVTKQSLLEDLENLRYSYYMEVQKTNPDGQPEPLMADYFLSEETGKGFVVLLKPFFQTYNGKTVYEMGANSNYYPEIATIILHEISHLYGVGIEDSQENNDKMAEEWAVKVGAKLTTMYELCSAENLNENTNSNDKNKVCLDYVQKLIAADQLSPNTVSSINRLIMSHNANFKVKSLVQSIDVLRLDYSLNPPQVRKYDSNEVSISASWESPSGYFTKGVVIESEEGIFYANLRYASYLVKEEVDRICSLLTKINYLGYHWELKQTNQQSYLNMKWTDYYCEAIKK